MARFFFGMVGNRIDAKQRVSVPAGFRATLAELGSPDTIVAYRSSSIDGLECGPEQTTIALAEELDSPDCSEDRQEAISLILAETRELKLDREGRISLPEDLMQQIGLTDEVMFIGQGKRFFMCSRTVSTAWTEAKLKRERAKTQARIDRLQDGAGR
ncbi:MAG: hypothetical protein SF002_07910 [Alphaproteobacteria bacterium]|nr:hypothetical protein [Alphaproteobacteria bacterium]